MVPEAFALDLQKALYSPGAFQKPNKSPFQENKPKGYRGYSLQQFTPEQMDIFSSLSPYLSQDSWLGQLAMGSNDQFAQMEEPALRQFNELIGGLSSRFSGQGMGARNSSGFQNTQTAAAQDFASQLQSNRMNLKRQALMDLMGLSSSFLGQRPYERGLVTKNPSAGQAFATGVAPGVGAAIGTGVGAYFGGPAGAMAGAGAGQALGQSAQNIYSSYG